MALCFYYFQEMAPKQPNTGLFVGLNKGHIVTKKELAPRPSDRKGVSNEFVLLIKFILFEYANLPSNMFIIIENTLLDCYLSDWLDSNLKLEKNMHVLMLCMLCC